MKRLTAFAAAALLSAPTYAAVISTHASGTLDSYSGEAYVTPPRFMGDPATLTTLDFRIDGLLTESVTVVGGTGDFFVHYSARIFNRTELSEIVPVHITLDANGSGSILLPFSMSFASDLIVPDPELVIAAFLTPVAGYMPSDASHRIGGSAAVTAMYDPPDPVPEPASVLLIPLVLGATIAGRRLLAR